MTWFMVGAAAVTVVSSASAGSAQARQINSQTVEGNEAIIKSNIANTIRTGYRVGLANMQRGLQKRQAVQHGFDITKAGVEALGQASANTAASGSVGASVSAVATDIKMKVGEAKAAAQNQADIDTANFQTQIENITFEGEGNIQEGIESKAQSSGEIWGGALMAGATQFATSYMGAKMRLGTGSSVINSNGSTAAGLAKGGYGTGTGFDSALWGMKR